VEDVVVWYPWQAAETADHCRSHGRCTAWTRQNSPKPTNNKRQTAGILGSSFYYNIWHKANCKWHIDMCHWFQSWKSDCSCIYTVTSKWNQIRDEILVLTSYVWTDFIMGPAFLEGGPIMCWSCPSACLSVPCLHLEGKRKGLRIPNLVERVPGTRAPRGPISRSRGQRSRSQDTVVVST